MLGDDATSVNNSAYTITTGSSSDYNFIYKTLNTSGNIADTYYKINLRTPGTSSKVTWMSVSADGNNVVTINLPNNITKYYKYATSASNYGRIYNYYGRGNVTGSFIWNYVFSSDSDAGGGAIYNYQGTIENIIGDFIGHHIFITASDFPYSIKVLACKIFK